MQRPRTRLNNCLLVAGLLATGALCGAQPQRTPVLLELFTSEGCSSCPPADELLARIDRNQPIPDVDLIVIGEHVDYWNHGGWVDPFSSAAFSERQQHYAALFRSDDVFTPQLVIDGAIQVVGSNWPMAQKAIERARQSSKLDITIESGTDSSGAGHTKMVLVKVNPNSALPMGDVFVAFAADTMSNQVKGGENSGRNLSHTAVAYQLTKVGKTAFDRTFRRSIEVPEHAKWGGRTRVIVFVQDPRTGRVLGSSQAKL